MGAGSQSEIEPRFCVAVSGGIASGKSAVAQILSGLGATIVDTDLLAREVVAVGTQGHRLITDSFGSSILNSEGALDRKALREHIFRDSEARLRLEAIVHPLIRQLALRRLSSARGPYAVLVVPLLVEHFSNYKESVNRVLIVDVSRSTQIKRLGARDGVSKELAIAMIDAQAKRDARLAIADDIIINEGTFADLTISVTALHRKYLTLEAAYRVSRS